MGTHRIIDQFLDENKKQKDDRLESTSVLGCKAFCDLHGWSLHVSGDRRHLEPIQNTLGRRAHRYIRRVVGEGDGTARCYCCSRHETLSYNYAVYHSLLAGSNH